MKLSELIELLQAYDSRLEVEVVYETYAQRPIESIQVDYNGHILIIAKNI